MFTVTAPKKRLLCAAWSLLDHTANDYLDKWTLLGINCPESFTLSSDGLA